MSHPKKGIRWKIFNLFGPPEVKNLIKYIDDMTEDGSDIMIYPAGDFSFNITGFNQDETKTLVFPTLPERTAFQNGLSYGVTIMGGTTTSLTQDDFDIIEQMRKKTTHGSGSGSMN